MTAYLQTLRRRESFSAGWYLTPILAATLVLSVFVAGHGGQASPAEASAAATPAATAPQQHALLLVSSPPPGDSESERVAGEPPASY